METHCQGHLKVRNLVTYAITALSAVNVDILVRKSPNVSMCTQLKTMDTQNQVPQLAKLDTKWKITDT
jgi:hypothetical protein